MLWARVDNRLVHGQVIETWLPFVGASIIVVANNELAGDVLQQEIMSLAVPSSVRILFSTLDDLPELMGNDPAIDPAVTLILFKDCCDARRAYEAGFSFSVINIGNLHYGPGKKQICSHVALSKDDEKCLRFFQENEVSIDLRCIPSVQVKSPGTW